MTLEQKPGKELQAVASAAIYSDRGAGDDLLIYGPAIIRTIGATLDSTKGK